MFSSQSQGTDQEEVNKTRIVSMALAATEQYFFMVYIINNQSNNRAVGYLININIKETQATLNAEK